MWSTLFVDSLASDHSGLLFLDDGFGLQVFAATPTKAGRSTRSVSFVRSNSNAETYFAHAGIP